MGFRKLLAYRKGFDLAMEIFEITKSFPKEERYSLTDQIRRSSRSVCINMAESYRKRIYPKHFISKLSDADSENAETLGWLEFASSCNYITKDKKKKLERKNIEVGKLINYMMMNPKKFE
ncbi:four helix bundle protein [Flavobacteriaceae bacterium F08102]|nr:four helix bundle protein [Flavobacteriaceae bacterium F08102]